MKYLDRGAQLSACGKYRYSLWRTWDESLPTVHFVGLNPSTADGAADDPTIRRCLRFAIAAGFGGLVMLNLWAFRTTHPEDLLAVETDQERENLDAIARLTDGSPRVVACWGAHAMARTRSRAVVPLVREWWCIGQPTKAGAPGHPLYIPGCVEMRRWDPPAVMAGQPAGGNAQ